MIDAEEFIMLISYQHDYLTPILSLFWVLLPGLCRETLFVIKKK